jgi:TorA maturation chaperone TorD
MSDAPIVLHHRLAPEDQARAEFYALLSRLYADVPDAPLLAAIASAQPLGSPIPSGDGDDAGGLAAAWEGLRSASATVEPEAAADEFLALFVGVGRSEVSLYASHYLGPQSGRPLAELRATLARLGLARRSDRSEFEDHLAVVLETMRMLVAGDDERHPAEITDQQAFFDRHVGSWAFDCCTAIRRCAIANYYVRVAEFTSSFLALERDSFAIE